jgi:hypothetical protein
MQKLREKLFEPVDIASLAVFRMCFGAILFWEVWRFFDYGWIAKYYIEPTFTFKYFGFGWLEPWPGNGMYYHFIAVGLFALCVMTGFLYRLSSWLLFFGFTYWYLLDQTRYLNHLYLTALLAFLMALIPAHQAKSLDVRFRPGLGSETIPTWCLWLLRTQVGIVYFFAGVAKLNGDWLRGEPIRQWLADRSDYLFIGGWLNTESAVWFFGYGGILFDLLIVPALLWRKTRVWAFAACVVFHVLNKMMYGIGIFPTLMLAATLLMFPADWPRKLLLFFKPLPKTSTSQTSQEDKVSGLTTNPKLTFDQDQTTTRTSHRVSMSESRTDTQGRAPTEWRKYLVMLFVGMYLALQLFMPLRHFLYPGTVHWTEEGHRFSWHMKLRQKRGDVRFYAMDPATGKTWRLPHSEHLSAEQSSQVGRWPDMCIQFAHFLSNELKKEGPDDIEIRAITSTSLNGRTYQDLVDPDTDLTKESRNLWHADWIVPLYHPLPAPRSESPND